MEHNTEKLLSAIGDVDAAYLEEALDFDAANAGRKRAARFPKLSAACVAVLVILGVSVTPLPSADCRCHGATSFLLNRPSSVTMTRFRWSPNSNPRQLRRSCTSVWKR